MHLIRKTVIKPRGRQCPRTKRWTVTFPDVPEARGECSTLDGALDAAHAARESQRPIPRHLSVGGEA
ncbi:hypothetical protein LA345_38765 (plasmid) [Burkholderia vietnamiensis]|nr:hypothetical protein [Burkholderia vietnamiensis]